MHTLTTVEWSSAEYEFVVNTLLGTIIVDFGRINKHDDIKLYKIDQNVAKKDVVQHKGNLMLMHGTQIKHLESILNQGFMSSQSGLHGQGLYMTNCIDEALAYCEMYRDDEENKYFRKSCVFLNEVLHSSQVVNKVFPKYSALNRNANPVPTNLTHHYHISSSLQTKHDYACDQHERLYRKSSVSKWGHCNCFVVNAEMVRPRYILVMKTSVNMGNLLSLLEFKTQRL